MNEEKKQVEEALQVLAQVCANNIVCYDCPMYEDICDGESIGLRSQVPYDWFDRR